MGLRIAIVGYGKMGRSIERLAAEQDCEVARIFRSTENANAVALNRDSLFATDVVIEFTMPQAGPQNLLRLIEAGVPVVTGTTGWFAELPQIREVCESKNGSVVWGSNFSVGLHHFRATVAEAARRFAREESYDAWGWEIHHAAKKDAPSGTLLALAGDISRSGYARPVSRQKGLFRISRDRGRAAIARSRTNFRKRRSQCNSLDAVRHWLRRFSQIFR